MYKQEVYSEVCEIQLQTLPSHLSCTTFVTTAHWATFTNLDITPWETTQPKETKLNQLFLL